MCHDLGETPVAARTGPFAIKLKMRFQEETLFKMVKRVKFRSALWAAVPLLLSKQEDKVNDAKAKANILAKCNGHDGNVFQQLKTSVRIHNTQTFKISPMIVLF